MGCMGSLVEATKLQRRSFHHDSHEQELNSATPKSNHDDDHDIGIGGLPVVLFFSGPKADARCPI